jgi:hypothetical protein
MQKADSRLDDEETLKICVELENAELTLEMMYKIGNDILKKLSSLRTNFTGNSTL